MRPAFAAVIRHVRHCDALDRAHSEALRNRLRRLHPETNGMPGLVHNWGNEEARAMLRRSNERAWRFSDYSNRRYRELMRADVRATGGNPLF